MRYIFSSIFFFILTVTVSNAQSLFSDFANPPTEAKPLMIWQWMDGLVTREAITQELEAYKKAGIAGVHNFQIGGKDQTLVCDTTNAIGSENWCSLMRFAMNECQRLGLTFGTHNCPGWSSSGYPNVKVENSMQKIVWSETPLHGSRTVSMVLPRPEVDSKWNYYEDIAVIALPDKPIVKQNEVVDVTGQMNKSGKLQWKVPAGEWIVLRIGHTTTGQTNSATAPVSGTGLECDKMSRRALDAFWDGYPSMLLNLSPDKNGSTFNMLEIDSYEAGAQNWTENMEDEFMSRRGYSLRKWLPVLTGKTIGSKDLSQRFLYDYNETITDLFAENYYAYMGLKVSQYPGMKLLIQPYGPTIDTQKVSASGNFSLSGEFWTHPDTWGWNTLEQIASAAHTTGHRILTGEAFTCWPVDAWGDDPYSLKSVADIAYCGGINRFMLHAATVCPWKNVKPGMTFGMWGTQFTENQTWWDVGAKPLFDYFSRCQALLQRGVYVADICFLNGKDKRDTPTGYSSDIIGEKAFLNGMSVKDGRLILPDGMSYSLLVLPDNGILSIEAARKVRELVNDGACVFGTKFNDVTGLHKLTENRNELAEIANELWQDSTSLHHVGKGLVISNMNLAQALKKLKVNADFSTDKNGMRWIHRKDLGTDIYFIANTTSRSLTARVQLRGKNKSPELLHPDTGKREIPCSWDYSDGYTYVDIPFDPHGSVFVILRQDTLSSTPGLRNTEVLIHDSLPIRSEWTVTFNQDMGAPGSYRIKELKPWNESEVPGIKYYSGTATYMTTFQVPRKLMKTKDACWLSLGEVKNCAVVTINGHRLDALWKPPFKINVSKWLRTGKNQLKVEVTNLWINRMVGDEFEEDDVEWAEMLHYSYAPGNPPIGRFMKSIPDWLKNGEARPSKKRYTLSSFKFFTTRTPLVKSGLMGPVNLYFHAE